MLDAATGTGIALRALAERYPLYDRLVGLDLIPDEFSPEEEREAANGSTLEFGLADVVQGLGGEHQGKYDLVSLRCPNS